MTFRRRLGVLATAVSGLLVAGLLLSAPAFAWSATIKDLTAQCPPGSDKDVVSGHVILSEEKVGGHVVIEFRLDSGDFVQVIDQQFSAGQTNMDFSFSVPGDEGTVAVRATAFFDDNTENPSDTKMVDLEKCKPEETTTTVVPTTAPPTTAPPTTAALGKAATTVRANKLPLTGANSLPLLIAAVVLVAGGGGLLYAARVRARHAK